MKLRGNRRPVALLIALVLLSACGARVSDTQRASAVGGSSGGGLSAGPGASGNDVGSATDGSPAGGGTDGSGSGGGSGVSGLDGATATTLPAGGNGGATDVGVTADTITLGTVTTLSGPVPGLFQGASLGVQAFVAYVNSQGGVNGRQLKLVVRDDQFDSGQHRAQTQDLAPKVLGFLGSFSLFDDSGVPIIEQQGMPDVGYGLTDTRRKFALNFSPQPAESGTFRTGGFIFYAKRFPEAVKAVGTIYGDVPASKAAALDSMAAARSVGWNFVYERGYQPTETDFTADIVRMRQAGVKAFFTTSADAKTMARIVNAMKQQNFEPEFIGFGASGYDRAFLTLAGAAAEGVWVDQQLALYAGEDAQTVPEVGLMNQWLQKVKPNYVPDLFAAYGWASGRILLHALQEAGPNLTREAVLASLRKLDDFDANGLLANAGPASKRQPTCNLFMQVKGGKFTRVEPAGKGFLCEGEIFRK